MDSIPEFDEEIEMIGSEEERRVAVAMGGGGGGAAGMGGGGGAAGMGSGGGSVGTGAEGLGKGKGKMSPSDEEAANRATYGSQFDAEYAASDSGSSANGSDASGDAAASLPSPPLPSSPPFPAPLAPNVSPASPTLWYTPLSPILPGPPDGTPQNRSKPRSTPSSSPSDSTFSTLTTGSKPNSSPVPSSSSASSSASPPPASIASSAPGGGLCPGIDGGICNFRMSSRTHFLLMRFISLVTVVSGLGYLSWKCSMVGRNITQAGPACLLFLSTEILVFLSSFMLVVELSKPAKERKALSLPPSGPFPRVAILICCCSEKIDVIQDTVKGAMNQNYPGERYSVWVLDDGGDDELKAWVEAEAMEGWSGGGGGGGAGAAGGEVGGGEQDQSEQGQLQRQQQLMVQQQQQGRRLFYLRRPKKKGVPHHFKAGNINYGLHFACGEFVAVLDADMIPSPFFLSALLPHIVGEEKGDVAFVQCPQSFYNIVKGDPLNDSSQDFYDVLLPYRDGRDSSQCVGTGVIFRAAHLQAVGHAQCVGIGVIFRAAHLQAVGQCDFSLLDCSPKPPFTSPEMAVTVPSAWAQESFSALPTCKRLDGRDSAQCVGTGVIFRAAHLQAIGGFTVGSITEDFDTAMTLHAKGYKTAYVNQCLCFTVGSITEDFDTAMTLHAKGYKTAYFNQRLQAGLAPWSLEGYIKQHQRWATGSLQILLHRVQYYLNVIVIMILVLPVLILALDLRIMPPGPIFETTRLYIILLVPYVFTSRLLCLGLFSRLPNGMMVQLRGEQVTSWAPFILFSVQSMLVPIIHVIMSPTHPKVEDRRKYLNYDEYGVPYLRPEQLLPKRDYRILLFNVIPAIWAVTIGFYFYAAITNFRPGFCTKSGFFGYPSLSPLPSPPNPVSPPLPPPSPSPPFFPPFFTPRLPLSRPSSFPPTNYTPSPPPNSPRPFPSLLPVPPKNCGQPWFSFTPLAFLQRMSNRVFASVGDSLSVSNPMPSLLCQTVQQYNGGVPLTDEDSVVNLDGLDAQWAIVKVLNLPYNISMPPNIPMLPFPLSPSQTVQQYNGGVPLTDEDSVVNLDGLDAQWAAYIERYDVLILQTQAHWQATKYKWRRFWVNSTGDQIYNESRFMAAFE
ncbi:unnamed protein product [Closterium sp. Naga37s-1]|nr:unnamed protein product [Closterium sp. Naga37s-1]